MKNIRLMLILAILLTPFGSHAKEVSFASFNLFWLFNDKAPHKKWWDEQRGELGQTYQEALALVAAKIVEIDADVLAIQEIENGVVLNDLITKLNDEGLNYEHSWICKCGDNTTGQDVALLSKFAKHSNSEPVREYKTEREGYLTEADRGNEKDTGISKALRVDLDIDGQQIPVFVFHLKSQRGGSESDSQRLAQGSIVCRITLPLIHEQTKFLVMGDLNADRGSPTLLRIRGFDDIYPDLIQPIHSKKFNGDKWTYKFDGRPEQIDHILLSPTLRNKVKSGTIFYGHDKGTSDHQPIQFVVDL